MRNFDFPAVPPSRNGYVCCWSADIPAWAGHFMETQSCPSAAWAGHLPAMGPIPCWPRCWPAFNKPSRRSVRVLLGPDFHHPDFHDAPDIEWLRRLNTSSDLTALSDEVIGTLVMMQGQESSATSGLASNASTANDPVQQAFSSIDTDGDGTISQTELESFIQNQGGTAAQADALYQGLGGSDGSGISQSVCVSRPGRRCAGSSGRPWASPPPSSWRVQRFRPRCQPDLRRRRQQW